MNKLLQKLQQYDQTHLLNFYDELSEDERTYLLQEIEKIDFELMKGLYECVDVRTADMKYVTEVTATKKEEIEDKEKYIQIGAEIIRNGELAVCSMAGGQGTRLGHNGPKGTFIVDINPPKSIFQILTEKLIKVYEQYGIYVNWYIMTSEANNDETIKYFEENNYFNYNKNHIRFFKQGELPLLDMNGKVVLKEKSKIHMAADGNGGVFEALYKNKILEDMKEKNIKYLCLGNVDNILIKQVDEFLLGMMKDKNYSLAGKAIPKRSPDEPVGVFCKINEQPSVIEYSDIDKELANKTNENGELIFGKAHFGCNTFSLDLLEKIATKKLPYHTAKKKNSYIDENGKAIEALEPNTYKFEAFIFDGFIMADDIFILECKREEEFAPIKNKEGNDSPETAKELYLNFYQNS